MRMLTKNDPTSAVVENWLAAFEQALAAPNAADLRALFRPDCHWRDVLALTWTIQTLGGRDAVVSAGGTSWMPSSTPPSSGGAPATSRSF
jgi:putative flavoprotein involved in K+ transport